MADDTGVISAVKEVTLEHCKRGAGTEGESRSWKPLSLPEREYRAAQSVETVRKNHPGLLEYFGPPREMEDGAVCLEREWAEGESFEALLKRSALTRLQGLDIISQVLDAASCLHDAGVVHRDIKPMNIIVHLEDGRVRSVKLIDLGAAAMKGVREDRDTCTQMTTCFFTPGFGTSDSMVNPCEQDDLFSIGATLLYALTGKDAEDIHDRGNAVFLIPDDITGPLRKVLENTLQVRVDKRYVSCEKMKKSLKKAIDQEVKYNPEMKLERTRTALAKLDVDYTKAANAIRFANYKVIDSAIEGGSGVITALFKWHEIEILVLPISIAIRAIMLAFSIPKTVVSTLTAALLLGAEELTNGPIRALHKLPKRKSIQSLERTIGLRQLGPVEK